MLSTFNMTTTAERIGLSFLFFLSGLPTNVRAGYVTCSENREICQWLRSHWSMMMHMFGLREDYRVFGKSKLRLVLLAIALPAVVSRILNLKLLQAIANGKPLVQILRDEQ